jgi:hypothetical protein
LENCYKIESDLRVSQKREDVREVRPENQTQQTRTEKINRRNYDVSM